MLSVVILTKNEEKNIEHVLKSVSFADEILVVDDHSSDETVLLAKKHGAKIVEFKGENDDFSKRRNVGMKEARNTWILYVDADEEVSKELAKDIQATLVSPKDEAYRISREDVFWNKKVRYGEVWAARSKGIIRLVKKGSGTWRGKVHEEFETEGAVGRLQGELIHRAHDSIADFLGSINYYSTLRAQELHKKGITTNALEISVIPLGKFLVSYFFLLGFLDGAQGFVYSFMMAFHSFLVRSKLYLISPSDK